MGSAWTRDLRYRDDSLVTNVVLTHEAWGLELRCCDAVDFDLDIYLKEIRVINLENRTRRVTLFFAHDFHLYGHDNRGHGVFRSTDQFYRSLQRQPVFPHQWRPGFEVGCKGFCLRYQGPPLRAGGLDRRRRRQTQRQSCCVGLRGLHHRHIPGRRASWNGHGVLLGGGR